MEEYTVEITETLMRRVVLRAEDKETAYQMMRELYRYEEIILDAEDHIKTSIEVIDVNT